MASSSKPAQSMAELMAKFGKEIHALQKGQEVTGIVTSITPQEVLVRIDNKTDAVIFEKDRNLHRQLMELLKVGDTVNAKVLYPESDNGYPAVTIRPFLEQKMWESLSNLKKDGAKVVATVIENTKGGLVVAMDNGVQGFLPNSHMVTQGNEEKQVGEKIQVSIAELNKENKKIVFSQKEQLSQEDLKKLASQYKEGTKVEGKISGITTFGIFVSLPYVKATGERLTVDGLVHISEIGWEKVADLHDLFSLGQEVSAVVIGVDPKSKRIDLSIKRLTKDPFQQVLDAFSVDKKVTGTAKEMTEDGLIVDLGEIEGVTVEGLMKKDKIPPTTKYEIGQKITATVVSVDNRKRKVMLTPVLLEKPLMYR